MITMTYGDICEMIDTLKLKCIHRAIELKNDTVFHVYINDEGDLCTIITKEEQ